MPDTENQAVKDYRSELLSKAKERYPDRVFEGQRGENGESAVDTAALEQAIYDMLLEKDEKISESDSWNEKLTSLFLNDPSSAEFINRWLESGDPRTALVETFGDELSDLGTEEGRSKFADGLEEWRRRKSENDRLSAEADGNWQRSLEDLDAWGDEHGLGEEQKVSVITRLIKIAADGLMNRYAREDFDLVLKEMNYGPDIEAARHEGEVAGRNAKIEAAVRSRDKAAAMPPALSGQSLDVPEVEPEKKPRSVFSGLR